MKVFIFVIIALSAMAQAPQGLTASMDESASPELKALIYWQPVAGATEHKVYKGAGGLGTCQNAYPAQPDAITTTNFYSDDPNPQWWKIPVTDGSWKQRLWCYAVSAVVNGIESAKSASVFVAIGNSGYLNLTYKNVCGGPNIVPFPYLDDSIKVHFYYTDMAGIEHEFDAVHIYNAYPYPAGDPNHSYNEEWEWKLPTIAIDGTVVPWDRNGRYTYSMRTPDGGYSSGWFSPRYQLDASFYNQVTLARIPNSAYNDWCPIYDGPGGNYSLWQNVTR